MSEEKRKVSFNLPKRTIEIIDIERNKEFPVLNRTQMIWKMIVTTREWKEEERRKEQKEKLQYP